MTKPGHGAFLNALTSEERVNGMCPTYMYGAHIHGISLSHRQEQYNAVMKYYRPRDCHTEEVTRQRKRNSIWYCLYVESKKDTNDSFIKQIDGIQSKLQLPGVRVTRGRTEDGCRHMCTLSSPLLSRQSCPTLCDSTDGSARSGSHPWSFQAGTLSEVTSFSSEREKGK